MKPFKQIGYDLLHEGILTFSEIERNGIRVDVQYLEQKVEELELLVKDLIEDLKRSKLGSVWYKTYKGGWNWESSDQLKYILFEKLGIHSIKETAKGGKAVDAEVLINLKEEVEGVSVLLDLRKWSKALNTYIRPILRNTVNGYLYCSFSLHTVRTYRSCIAGYEKVTVLREANKAPEGIPIKDIRAGDCVYCFDDNLNPTIQKVLWQGKTGHREVVRVHYYRRGKKGSFDCTPEHRVRLIDGSYVEAQHLMDGTYIKRHRNSANVRALSCSRVGDEVNFTNHLKNGRGIKEHRFVYENLIGPLYKKEVVHHKNGDHSDNDPSNLEKMSLSDHSRLHYKNTIGTQEAKRKSVERIREDWRLGKRKALKGSDNPNFLGLTKYKCLKGFSVCGGKLKNAAHYVCSDFDTFKGYLKSFGVDPKIVKLRYDKNGEYISRGRLVRLSKLGRSKVQKILGHNHYKLLDLYEFYSIDSKRRWGNQEGPFLPGNHAITDVEWIDEKVDVYDIEVEKYHNFFVNEICVHNSSQDPNFQNIPIRDPEVGAMIRRAFIPRKGRRILEVDFSGLEVRIAACYHKDKRMMEYINDPTKDMHRDMACECFILPVKEVTKLIRYVAKNRFVFPSFYGSYYAQIAPDMWKAITELSLVTTSGIPLKEHLASKRVRNYDQFEAHIKKVEERFWGTRFKEYSKWKDDWYTKYLKCGYFDLKTGFRISGEIKRNDVINYPIQGSAFHCLLWCVIQLQGYLEGRKSMIIGQIHDSIVLDVVEDELQALLDHMSYLMCRKLQNEWKWINVPLDTEVEITGIDQPWNKKAEWVKADGKWKLKAESAV